MTYRVIIAGLLTPLLVVPQTVAAQLTSSNYQIDNYVIGEGTTGQGTSSNFTAEFGVTNFEYDETADSGSGGTSGSRVSENDDEEETGTPASTTTSPTTEPSAPLPTDPATVTPTPYVAPVPDEFVAPPTTVEEISDSSTITVTPQYQVGSDEALAAADDEFINFYTVLPDGSEAYVQVLAGTFLIPQNYTASSSYQLFITVEAHPLTLAQRPDTDYQASLIGETVYTISVIDSLGTVITEWEKPISVTINTKSNIDLTLGVSGYLFNKALRAWVATPNVRFDSRSVTVGIEYPVLFGLWHVPGSERILYLDTGPAPTNPTVTTTCLTILGICWYWWLLTIPVLYFVLRAWRRMMF